MKFGSTLRSASVIISLLVISTLLHTRWCGTPFHLADETWQKIVDFHSDLYPYNLRILTTPTVNAIHNLSGLSLKVSFGLLQLALALLLGIAFSRLLRQLGIRSPWREIGLASLLMALPLIFAVSEPIHTWDDIWGYLLLTLCTSAIVRDKAHLAGLWFLAACFAREQTLIYYPLFAAGIFFMTNKAEKIRNAVAVISPLVIFGTYLAMVWQEPESKRFQLLLFNFDGFLRTRDSIYSIFMAFGWLWVGWILALRWKPAIESSPQYHRMLKISTFYSMPLTVVFATTLTLVRETRILFPPAILVIPFVMIYAQEKLGVLRMLTQMKRKLIVTIAVSLSLLSIGIWLGLQIFPTFEYRQCPTFSRAWAGVQIGLSFCLVYLLTVASLMRRPLGKPLI